MIFYCCRTIYSEILKAQIKHKNLFYSLLNLFIRRSTSPMHEDRSFVFINKFDRCAKIYRLKVMFCQCCFHTVLWLRRKRWCSCKVFDEFDCEKCRHYFKFLQENFFLIKLLPNITASDYNGYLSGYNLTGLQYMRYVIWRKWHLLLPTKIRFLLSMFF